MESIKREIINGMIYGYAYACAEKEEDKIMLKALERFAELNDLTKMSELLESIKKKTNDNN